MDAVGGEAARQVRVGPDQEDEAARAGQGAQARRLLEDIRPPERSKDYRGAAGESAHHARRVRRSRRIGDEVEVGRASRGGLSPPPAAA
jgi:hypothetical protein